jgi:cytochrome c peroxidase
MSFNSFAEPISPIPRTIEFDKNKQKLGKKLFHERKLSSDNSISCASCHNVKTFGVDNSKRSSGVEGKIGDRNSPTVYNVRFNESQFWDGRASDLEEQIEGPIHNPVEMNSNWKDIVSKLKRDFEYLRLFKTVYPKKGISKKTIKDAIVEYEKALITPGSPFDKYLNGSKTALTKNQQKGYQLFKSYGCISCHQGVNIGGNMLQVFGVAKPLPKNTLGKDKGRFNLSQDIDDLHLYKVPSLRNIERTAPYFHDGSVHSLKDAIRIMGRYQIGEEINQGDINLIHDFLISLTGEPINE